MRQEMLDVSREALWMRRSTTEHPPSVQPIALNHSCVPTSGGLMHILQQEILGTSPEREWFTGMLWGW